MCKKVVEKKEEEKKGTLRHDQCNSTSLSYRPAATNLIDEARDSINNNVTATHYCAYRSREREREKRRFCSSLFALTDSLVNVKW